MPSTACKIRAHLTGPEASLITQYKTLMGTEDLTLDFTGDAVDALVELAADINAQVENIGAAACTPCWRRSASRPPTAAANP